MTSEYDDKIEQLAQTHNEDAEELKAKHAELVDEEADKGVDDPGRRALRRLSLEVKGAGSSSAGDSEEMMGVVYGASEPINTTDSSVRRAKEFINNSGVERAVDMGLVKVVPDGTDTDGIATLKINPDDRDPFHVAVLDDNDSSPTAGEVLPAEDYIRYVYGVVFRSPDSEPQWFTTLFDGDGAADVPETPPLHEPVKFEASWVGESDRNNTIRLRFPDETAFETVDGGPDPVELLEDGDDGVGHTALAEADADDFGRNDIVATYGSVTYMELAPPEGQNRRLSLVDPFDFGSDLERTVWLPDHVDVNFAEESDVYVIGQVSMSSNDYPDSVEAVGVLPHPDYVVDRQGIDPMADDGDGGPDTEQEATVEGVEQDDGGPEPVEEAGEPYAGAEPDAETAEHEADFETGSTIEDSEQAAAADDGEHIPDAVAEADYTELQSAAAEVEEVPGSGIGEDEMREQLLEARGPGWLAEQLAGDDALTGDDAESGGDGDGDAAEQGAGPAAATDGGNGAETEGPFEEDEGDKEWNW